VWWVSAHRYVVANGKVNIPLVWSYSGLTQRLTKLEGRRAELDRAGLPEDYEKSVASLSSKRTLSSHSLTLRKSGWPRNDQPTRLVQKEYFNCSDFPWSYLLRLVLRGIFLASPHGGRNHTARHNLIHLVCRVVHVHFRTNSRRPTQDDVAFSAVRSGRSRRRGTRTALSAASS
jgi:hypothetical protein